MPQAVCGRRQCRPVGTASIDWTTSPQDGKVDDDGGVERDPDTPHAYKHLPLASVASLATQEPSATRAVECSAVCGRAAEIRSDEHRRGSRAWRAKTNHHTRSPTMTRLLVMMRVFPARGRLRGTRVHRQPRLRASANRARSAAHQDSSSDARSDVLRHPGHANMINSHVLSCDIDTVVVRSGGAA